MSKRKLAYAVAVSLLLIGLPLVWASGEELVGKVVGVQDGDSITVLVGRQQVRVRLAEIDAPERGQPWSSRSNQALSGKVFGKPVELHVVDEDRYGRSVAHVYVEGRHINRELVREGHAWAFRRYLQDRSLLDDEATARTAGAGLWGLSEAPVPPWEYRAARREGRAPAPFADPDRPTSGCGAKRYCREMASCEEAIYYLEACGLTRLDGNGDRVPCEALCR